MLGNILDYLTFRISSKSSSSGYCNRGSELAASIVWSIIIALHLGYFCESSFQALLKVVDRRLSISSAKSMHKHNSNSKQRESEHEDLGKIPMHHGVQNKTFQLSLTLHRVQEQEREKIRRK